MTCDITGYPNGVLTWSAFDNGFKDIYKNGTLTNSTNLAFSVTTNSTTSTLTLTSVSQSSMYACCLWDLTLQMPYVSAFYSLCLCKPLNNFKLIIFYSFKF
jgi:hypothetical protein